MPRKPRIDVPGLIYHIIARGIERREIFSDDRDYQIFLNRLGTILVDTGTPIYAFSLIPNHFHLLIRRTKYPMSTIMRRLLTGYALYYNKRYNRAGHLFQNRYKSIICDEDAYLFELIRYINLNPLRAKVVNTIDDLESYPYSSHPYLTGKKGAKWFDEDAILSRFSKKEKVARSRYGAFLKDGLFLKSDFDGAGSARSLRLANHLPGNQAFDDRILGEGYFVEMVLKNLGKVEKNKSQDEAGAIIDLICKEYNITEIELTKRTKRSEIIKARWDLIFRLSRETELNNSQIAARLKLTRSAVSKIMARHREILR